MQPDINPLGKMVNKIKKRGKFFPVSFDYVFLFSYGQHLADIYPILLCVKDLFGPGYKQYTSR